MKKVLVIGLDGATFDNLKPWIKEGKLPNLEKMMDKGTNGVLTSTSMPLSPPAWTSGLTGKNPGKHGIFDFFERDSGSYDLVTTNARTRDSKMVWELLSDSGKKVGVINVPITYPPDKVNGFMISGLGTPGVDSEFTYPADLYAKLIGEIGDYKIDIGKEVYEKNNENALLEDLRYITQKRADAMFHLMDEYEWDFFMVVFRGADWVQHFFWKYMDKTHPMYDEEGAKKYGGAILQYYQNFDRILGETLEYIDKNTTVIIMSDHGFCPLHNNVFLNHWLKDIGLLHFKKTWASSIKKWAFEHGITVHNVYNFLAKLKIGKFLNFVPRKTKYRILDASFLSFSDIDWSKTKVYCPRFYGQLFVNLKGREPEGVVGPGKEYEELIEYLTEELYKIRDPGDGKKIVDRVIKGRDVYFGKHSNRAPDLMCVMRNWTYRGSPNIRAGISLTGRTIPDSSGGHDMNGIVMMAGENIKKGAMLKNANIIDITPTILHLMGVPVPDDMDGKVLTDTFEESFLRDNPIRYQEVKGGKDKVREKIRELKALGRI